MNRRAFHIKLSFLCFIMSMAIQFAKAQCTASFIDTSSVCGQVQFTNTSTGTNSTTSYFWDFGNSTNSNVPNPTGSYTANGVYTVCLNIWSVPTCSSTICKTVSINCFTTSCTANFSSSACIVGQMSFINTSPGTNSTTVYDWDFGNSTTSTQQNPTATYTANGIYTVCLSYTTSAPAYCTATLCKTVNINCISGSCTANFTPSSCVGGQMAFINTSTGTNTTTVYSWNFGNSTTSTQQNPTATFTANGIYTVCLSFTNASPSCSANICQTVNINCVPAPTCQANFTNSPCNNGQVTFWSTSTGTNSSTSYTWTNSAPPNQPSPPAPYNATVCLTMVNTSPACSSSVCKVILIDCSVIGIAEFIFEHQNIRIFPNPSNGLFTIDLSKVSLRSNLIHFKVYNCLGELVHQNSEELNHNSTNKQINLQDLPNGAYYLRLNVGDKAFSTKLIITK